MRNLDQNVMFSAFLEHFKALMTTSTFYSDKNCENLVAVIWHPRIKTTNSKLVKFTITRSFPSRFRIGINCTLYNNAYYMHDYFLKGFKLRELLAFGFMGTPYIHVWPVSAAFGLCLKEYVWWFFHPHTWTDHCLK